MTTSKKAPRLPEVAAKIYDLMEPLDAADRSRVLQGVLGLLGEESITSGVGAPTPMASGGSSAASPSGHARGAKAQAWLRKHALTDQQLETIFHFDGNVELIAIPPGSTKREQTINAYLLLGAQELLANDEPRFTETNAVALCKRLGCYDGANHALTRSKFGNRITGSKESGYALTVPGLDAAAAAIKQLAPAS